MYKPIYGICICHGKKRLLVIKSGLCKQGNDERKSHNNTKEKSGYSEHIGKSKRTIFSYRKVTKTNILDKRQKHEKSNTPKFKKRKPIQHRKKGTGEKQVFEAILKERGHTSQISGTWLGEGFNPWWFSHIVPKSIAPGLRLDPRNIILMTPDEHILYENHKHKIKHLMEWKWIFELEEKLKIEYYNK